MINSQINSMISQRMSQASGHGSYQGDGRADSPRPIKAIQKADKVPAAGKTQADDALQAVSGHGSASGLSTTDLHGATGFVSIKASSGALNGRAVAEGLDPYVAPVRPNKPKKERKKGVQFAGGDEEEATSQLSGAPQQQQPRGVRFGPDSGAGSSDDESGPLRSISPARFGSALSSDVRAKGKMLGADSEGEEPEASTAEGQNAAAAAHKRSSLEMQGSSGDGVSPLAGTQEHKSDRPLKSAGSSDAGAGEAVGPVAPMLQPNAAAMIVMTSQEFDEFVSHLPNPQRSWLRLQFRLRLLCESNMFNNVFLLLIIVNTALLALEYDGGWCAVLNYVVPSALCCVLYTFYVLAARLLSAVGVWCLTWSYLYCHS